MSHQTAIITIRNLSKTFQVADSEQIVLRNIDLTVTQGDFVIIFGPSGCGKSTLLHVLLGLEPPTTGQVQVLGFNLYAKQQAFNQQDQAKAEGHTRLQADDRRSKFRKQHIGMVYQQPYWIRSLNVSANVAFPYQLLGNSKQAGLARADKMLQMVGMQAKADYFPTELSSGQQQRVNLARALITNPEILVLDEPTGNLDFKAGKELMKLLSRLNQEGKTILMVTHDLEFLSYAQTAARMLAGEIKQIYQGEQRQQLLQDYQGKRGVVEKGSKEGKEEAETDKPEIKVSKEELK